MKKVLAIAAFPVIFLICFSPYAVYSLITGTENLAFKGVCFDYRMEALALFMGIGLIVSGISAIARRKVAPTADSGRPLNPIEEQRIKEQNRWYRWRIPATFVLKGKQAIRWGTVSIIFGIVFVIWSSSFWLKVFIPAVLKALNP